MDFHPDNAVLIIITDKEYILVYSTLHNIAAKNMPKICYSKQVFNVD
jgi:hypothetical protein